jgi:hypothetical protein
MSTSARQSNLLVQKDWTKIYQTFTNADFVSYDFETLRNTMLNYLQTYYPEDFNDYTESSEYLALIDMIAFLGQSLSFRTDLNARENYIDTAERRDSVLKLARMLSYNPQRSTSASGLLKIDNIRTTESVTDSNGINLANRVINWNDVTNSNWLEQFTLIMNSAMITSQQVGKPGNSQTLNGILTDEYSINSTSATSPVVPFQVPINGVSQPFEAVSATSVGQTYLYESDPTTAGKFNILYRNDNNGNGSNNTGFFVYFKQGTMSSSQFSINNAIPNNIVPLNVNNVNNTDQWLYQLNNSGFPSTKWSKVPAIAGLNVVYNQSSDKNLFQVNTRTNDQVDLVFGDGAFANIPQGNFVVFYRTSNGLSYTISPEDIQGVVISLVYTSKSGAQEILTVTASLKYTVTNASATQTLASIKAMAPQQYYTQNRMVTAEDYNIFPLTNFTSIQKVKAINRTSSGVSLNLDSLDPNANFSTTNNFGDDGSLYTNSYTRSQTFEYTDTNDIYNVIYNQVIPQIKSVEMSQFYYNNYPSYTTTATTTFNSYSVTTNKSTGNLTVGGVNNVQQIGPGVSSNLKYIDTGAVVKFAAPTGQYFDLQHNLRTGTPQVTGDSYSLYAAVLSRNLNSLDYLPSLANFATTVPTGAIIDTIFPTYVNGLTPGVIASMINLITSNLNFGLRYDQTAQTWKIIQGNNLAPSTAPFSLAYAGDTSSSSKDASWLLSFEYSGGLYSFFYRNTQYYFQSKNQTTFYFNPQNKIYDYVSGAGVIDSIRILKINTQADSNLPLPQDYVWSIYSTVTEADGYVSPDKVLVTSTSTMMEGVPDNPELFKALVAPAVNVLNKIVFFRTVTTAYSNFITYKIVDNPVNVYYPTLAVLAGALNLFTEGQVFYTYLTNKFYVLTNGSLVEDTSYVALSGRNSLLYQYKHNAPNRNRINPTPVNIIDMYILTTDYATSYQSWLRDTTGRINKPAVPTSTSLDVAYNTLENFKTVGDAIIYNPAQFKPLFGAKADPSLRARFKIVPNPNVNSTEYEIKTSVIAEINNYFDINNWDFGETFYFSELSAYLHTKLTPAIASIIIVPADTSLVFGNFYQINAQPWEIITSAATVNDVDIITAITAAQLNMTLSALNANNVLVGTY